MFWFMALSRNVVPRPTPARTRPMATRRWWRDFIQTSSVPAGGGPFQHAIAGDGAPGKCWRRAQRTSVQRSTRRTMCIYRKSGIPKLSPSDDIAKPLFVPLADENFRARAHHEHREEEKRETQPHDQQRDQHGRFHARLAQLGNRRRLVEGVPPLDRVLDDRDIDDADDR